MQRRKHIRCRGYDYSRNGCYFVTICAYDRKPIFGKIINNRDLTQGQQEQTPCPTPTMSLSQIGEVAFNQCCELKERFRNVELDTFVVMPNHLHGIITLNDDLDCNQRPTIGDILCAYKSITTKMCNKNDNTINRKIWKFRFHDRIIRDEKEYLAIYEYIENNHLRWTEDTYYC